MIHAGLHRHARAALRVVPAADWNERKTEAAGKCRRQFTSIKASDQLGEVEARIRCKATAAKLRFSKRRVGTGIQETVAEDDDVQLVRTKRGVRWHEPQSDRRDRGNLGQQAGKDLPWPYGSFTMSRMIHVVRSTFVHGCGLLR